MYSDTLSEIVYLSFRIKTPLYPYIAIDIHLDPFPSKFEGFKLQGINWNQNINFTYSKT